MIRAHRDIRLEHEAAPYDALGPSEPPRTVLNALQALRPLRNVWRQSWVVIGAVVACLLIAGIYLLIAKPVYTSTARIYVEPASFSKPTDPTASVGPAGMISQNFLNTQRELVKSTPVMALALGKPSVEMLASLEHAKDAFSDLRKRLRVTVGTTDDILSISAEAADPEEAANLANSVVDAYLTYNSNQRRNTAAEMLALIQKAKEERENELNKKTATFIAFKKANGIVGPTVASDMQPASAVADRVAALTQVLTGAQVDTLNAKSAYDEVVLTMKLPPEQLAAIESRETGTAMGDEAQLRNQLYVQQNRLQDLRRTYLPDHPLCKATQKQIDNLTASYVGTVHRRWQTAKRREESLSASIKSIQLEATERNVNVSEYARLEGEMKQAQQTVDLLESRIRGIDLSDGGALNITVIESASEPEAPTRPSAPSVILTALFIGLLIGSTAAVARQLLDQQMHSVEEIESALDTPILGVVPKMPQEMTPAARALQPHLDRASTVSEACRSARMAIKHRLASSNARTVGIGSALPGDGRSTFVANLAITMAQAGDRVLVVDADLFDPKQHQIFAMGNFHGVSRVLGESLPFEDGVRPTNIDKLDVLTAGPPTENASELLNSQAFGDLLGDLAGKYDFIVIDTPSPATGAAARIVTAACDATILVVNAANSNRKVAHDVLEGMLNVGANVIGVVVNELRTASPRYGYSNAPLRTPTPRRADNASAIGALATKPHHNHADEADEQDAFTFGN